MRYRVVRNHEVLGEVELSPLAVPPGVPTPEHSLPALSGVLEPTPAYAAYAAACQVEDGSFDAFMARTAAVGALGLALETMAGERVPTTAVLIQDLDSALGASAPEAALPLLRQVIVLLPTRAQPGEAAT